MFTGCPVFFSPGYFWLSYFVIVPAYCGLPHLGKDLEEMRNSGKHWLKYYAHFTMMFYSGWKS